MRGKVMRGSITITSRDGGNSSTLNRGGDGMGGSNMVRGDGNCGLLVDGGGDRGNVVSLVMGDGLSKMMSQSLDLVVRGGEGSFGLNKGFLSKDGLSFNDGMGDMFGSGNGTRNNFSNGSGLMDISGLSNGMGQS